MPVINTAIQDWAKNKMKTITYHSKGMNCLTEMYSALVAEVEIKNLIKSYQAEVGFLSCTFF